MIDAGWAPGMLDAEVEDNEILILSNSLFLSVAVDSHAGP
jgi:hypothetical protein